MRLSRFRRIVVASVLFSMMSIPSVALDAKTMRDISRADTPEKLSKLADDITKSAATRTPKDFEEGTQIAAETNSYLLYIITKQNMILMKNLQTQE